MTWSALGHHHSPVPTEVAFTTFNGLVLVTMVLTLVTGVDYIVKNATLIKGMLK